MIVQHHGLELSYGVNSGYRNGEVTLSRAAEMADLSVRSMIFELQHHGLELSYGVNDLAEDLQPL